MSTATRPMGEVIGRQPATPIINPSRTYLWYGEIVGGQLTGFGNHSVTGGERFTTHQVRAIHAVGLDPATVEAMTVRRNADREREIWYGPRSLAPVYEFECPILHRRADGRVKIIAPNGDGKFVYADGWTTPPPAKVPAWKMLAAA